jgi:hypothetical protein
MDYFLPKAIKEVTLLTGRCLLLLQNSFLEIALGKN